MIVYDVPWEQWFAHPSSLSDLQGSPAYHTKKYQEKFYEIMGRLNSTHISVDDWNDLEKHYNGIVRKGFNSFNALIEAVDVVRDQRDMLVYMCEQAGPRAYRVVVEGGDDEIIMWCNEFTKGDWRFFVADASKNRFVTILENETDQTYFKLRFS